MRPEHIVPQSVLRKNRPRQRLERRTGYGDTVATDLFKLPLPERLIRFRELADQARRFAAQIELPTTRDAYLRIADHWDMLARDLETLLAEERESE